MMRFFCQLPADIMLKLYYSFVYSHLTYALLAWGRSGRTNAAKNGCAHRRACKLLTNYNQKILIFHSIYDYFALLKAFNANTLNFNKYFNLDKLTSHKPSHMHNTRRPIWTIVLILIIEKLKNVFCTRQFTYGATFQVRIKIQLPN